eukprot:7227416-Alexandrium_andersonii.AAC.1
MEARYPCEVEGRLGGGESDLKEARLPNRKIPWAPSGLLVRGGPEARRTASPCFAQRSRGRGSSGLSRVQKRPCGRYGRGGPLSAGC